MKIECLYMFHYGNMVKVGISNDPWRRIATIQTSVPEDLGMIYLAVTESRELVRRWERSIHRRLAHRRVRGEWFRVDVEEAIEIAGRVVDQSTRKLMKGRPTSATTQGKMTGWWKCAWRTSGNFRRFCRS